MKYLIKSLVLLSGVALLGGLIGGCSVHAAIEAKGAENVPIVTLFTAKKEDLHEVLRYPARVIPKFNTTILSETDGIVKDIHAPLGRAVKEKQILVTIIHTDPVYQYAPVVLTSPIHGVVSSVDVTEGTQVVRGQKILSVTDPKKVLVSLEIPAQDIYFFTRRTTGELRFPGESTPMNVRIIGVSPFVDPATGTASAELEPDSENKTVRLVPGLIGQAEFKINHHEGIRIPDHALIYKEKTPYIRVVQQGKAKHVEVRLGLKRSGMVEITSGLSSEMQIIERSNRFVADGESVTVEKDPDDNASKEGNRVVN